MNQIKEISLNSFVRVYDSRLVDSIPFIVDCADYANKLADFKSFIQVKNSLYWTTTSGKSYYIGNILKIADNSTSFNNKEI